MVLFDNIKFFSTHEEATEFSFSLGAVGFKRIGHDGSHFTVEWDNPEEASDENGD